MSVREDEERCRNPVEGLVSIPLVPREPEEVTEVEALLEEPLKGKLVTFLQENENALVWVKVARILLPWRARQGAQV